MLVRCIATFSDAHFLYVAECFTHREWRRKWLHKKHQKCLLEQNDNPYWTSTLHANSTSESVLLHFLQRCKLHKQILHALSILFVLHNISCLRH